MFFYNELDSEASQIGGGSTDEHFDNVVLLMPMSTDFSDSSSHSHTVNTVGNTSIIDNGGDFDGSGDYITVSSPELAISANQAVTIEFDLRFDARDSAGAALFDYGTHNSVDDLTFLCQTDINGWQLTPWMSNVYNWDGSTMVDGSWHHVAFTRTSDGSWYSFVDGSIVQSGTGATGAIASNGTLRINGLQNYAGYEFNGGMKNFRITKGVARYTANFTPPTSHPTEGGPAPQPPELVTQDLVLHLDAGDTNSYSGTGTTWYDLSGNGNDATLINGPTYSSDSGGFISFDGSNNYADISSIDLDPNGAMSISFWFKTSNDSQTFRYMLDFRSQNATGQAAIVSYNNEGTRKVHYHVQGDGVTPWRSTSSGIALNSWNNIALIHNNAQDNLKIYLNSNLELDTTFSTDLVLSSSPLRIAARRFNGNNQFNGDFSQILTYNRALTDTEVLQNFNATKDRFGL